MGYTRELPAVFREKRPNRRDQFVGDLHHSLSRILECSLIFCNRFLIGQGLVMLKETLDTPFIPSVRKPGDGLQLPLLLMRCR